MSTDTNTRTTRLFSRGVRVTLITPQPGAYFVQGATPNAVVIEKLRVKFSIERSTKPEPNRCHVEIFNLAAQTRALCTQKPLVVRLDAGYDDLLRLVFQGDLTHGFSKLEKPEWITRLNLGDGDRAYRTARINRSYAAGTPLSRAVQETAQSMGVAVAQDDLARLGDLQQQFATSRAVQGSAAAEMTRLLAPAGIDWSFQNGRLTLLRDGDLANNEAIVVTEETGLVGTPEFTSPRKEQKPSQLKFKMLLYPQLSPGFLVKVTSRDIPGKLFRIQRVVHKGDTHGDEWLSEVEALPAS